MPTTKAVFSNKGGSRPLSRASMDLSSQPHPHRHTMTPPATTTSQHLDGSGGGGVARVPSMGGGDTTNHNTGLTAHTSPVPSTRHPHLPAAVVGKLREAFHMNHESIDSFWGIHTLLAEQCGVHITPDTLAMLLTDVGVVAKGLQQMSNRRNESGLTAVNKRNGSKALLEGDEGRSASAAALSTSPLLTPPYLKAADIDTTPMLLTEEDFLHLMARIATCTEYDTVFLDKDDMLLDEALYGEFFDGGEGVQGTGSSGGAGAGAASALYNNGTEESGTPEAVSGGVGGPAVVIQRTSILAVALPTTKDTRVHVVGGEDEGNVADITAASNLRPTTTSSNISAARLEKFLSRFGISTSMELLSAKYRDLAIDQRRKKELALTAPTTAASNQRRSTIRTSVISATQHGMELSNNNRQGSLFSQGSVDGLGGKRESIGGVEGSGGGVGGVPSIKAVKLLLHQLGEPGFSDAGVDEDIAIDALRSTIFNGAAPAVGGASSSPGSAGGGSKKARIREGSAMITTVANGGRKSVDPKGRSVLLPPLLDGSSSPPNSTKNDSAALQSRWRFEDFSPAAAAFKYHQSPSSPRVVGQGGGRDGDDMATNEEETAYLLVHGYLPGETIQNATPNLLYSTNNNDDKNMHSSMRRKFGSKGSTSVRRHTRDGAGPYNSNSTAAAGQMMLEHTFGTSVAESEEGSMADFGSGVGRTTTVPEVTAKLGGRKKKGASNNRHHYSGGNSSDDDDDMMIGDHSIDSDTAAVFFAVKQETKHAETVIRKLTRRSSMQPGGGGGDDAGTYSFSQSAGSKSLKNMLRQQSADVGSNSNQADDVLSQEEDSSTVVSGIERDDGTASRYTTEGSGVSSYVRRPKRQFGALTAHPSGGTATITTPPNNSDPTTGNQVKNNNGNSSLFPVQMSSTMLGSSATATPSSLSPLIHQLSPPNEGEENGNHASDPPSISPTKTRQLNLSPSSTTKSRAFVITQSQTGKLKKQYEKPWKMTKTEIQFDEKQRKEKMVLDRQRTRATAVGEDRGDADEDELLQKFIKSGGNHSRQAVVTSPPPKHWKQSRSPHDNTQDEESEEKVRQKWVSELRDFSTGELHELRPFVPHHIQRVIDGVLYARQEATMNELLRGATTTSTTQSDNNASASSPKRRGVSTGLVVEDRPLVIPQLTPNPFPKKIVSKLDSHNAKNALAKKKPSTRSQQQQSRAVTNNNNTTTISQDSSTISVVEAATTVAVDPLITRWISSSPMR